MMSPKEKAIDFMEKYGPVQAKSRLKLTGDMAKAFGNTEVGRFTNKVIKEIEKMQKEELK